MKLHDVFPLPPAAEADLAALSVHPGAPGATGGVKRAGSQHANGTINPVVSGVTIGRLSGFADNGRTPLVTLPAPDDLVARRARSAVDLHGAHVGKELVLACEGGDPSRPVVLALLREAAQPMSNVAESPASDSWRLSVDGERCVLSARHELVLECGRARLVLRADGRAELHGETVVTEAVGANKVRGGSVQLN